MASFKTSLFAAVCVFAFLACQTETRPTQDSEDQSTEERYFAHFKLTNKFNCRPRPHSIPVSDLVDVQSDEFFSPRMTVLHRCDRAAGCCHVDGDTCRVKATEEVELVFFVGSAVHEKAGKRKHRKNTFRSVTATNHTECMCGNGVER